MRDTSHNIGVSNHQTLLLWVISRQSTVFFFFVVESSWKVCMLGVPNGLDGNGDKKHETITEYSLFCFVLRGPVTPEFELVY